MSAYDDLLVDVAGNGRYQKFLLAVVLFQSITASFLHTSSVFLLGLPSSRCNIPSADNISVFSNESFLLEVFIPWDNATKDYSRCKQYTSDVSSCGKNYTRECIESVGSENRNSTPCTNGYHFDRSTFKETATTEWSLVCDDLYLMTLSSSAYYTGLLLGATVGGMIGDRFGRMLVSKIAAVLSFGACLALAFSPNVYVLILLRFLVAFLFMPITVCVVVYACEVSKQSVRPYIGPVYNGIFGVGCIILGGLAYALRSWRDLAVAFSATVIIVAMPLAILPKSPGWLMSRGRDEEAGSVCRVMAQRNRGKLDKQTLKEASKEARDSNSSVGLWEMMARPYLRFMLCSNATIWFITSLVYYGLTLNTGALAGNVYLNYAIGGVMEALSCLVSFFMITKLGRTRTTVLFLAVSSASCLLSTVIIELGGRNQGAQTAGVIVAMAGRFGSSAVFAVIYQHTAELFPTPGRATALGFSSMAARLASIFTPFTLQLQYSWPWVTPAIFGVLSLIGALLASLFPETKNKPVLTTFHQADVFMASHFRDSIASKIFCLPRGDEIIDTDMEEEKAELKA